MEVDGSPFCPCRSPAATASQLCLCKCLIFLYLISAGVGAYRVQWGLGVQEGLGAVAQESLLTQLCVTVSQAQPPILC